ncbi:MAG: hypothetical protein ACIAS6_05760 [Phycisphaerales bacterium JB060]
MAIIAALGIIGCGDQSVESSEIETPASAKQEELGNESQSIQNAAFEYHVIFLELQERGILAIDPQEGLFTGARQLERAQQQIEQVLVATQLQRCDWAQQFYYHGGLESSRHPHLNVSRYWQTVLLADAKRLAETEELRRAAERVAGVVRLAHQTASSDVLEWMAAIEMLADAAGFVQDNSELWRDEDRELLKVAFAQYEPEDPLSIDSILALDGEWAFRRRGGNPMNREFVLGTHQEQMELIMSTVEQLGSP